MSGATFCLFSLYAFNFPNGHGIDGNISVFVTSTCPHLKKRYHTRVKRVRKYLETVKGFDELISPHLFPSISLVQSLLTTFGRTLRLSRRVSLLNYHFQKLV